MPIDPRDARKVAVAMALGGIAGAAIIQSHHDQKRKSQAEKDDPEGVAWICNLVWDLLDDWEPPDYEREDDYTDDLVQFLRDELSCERGEDGRRISVTKRTKTYCGIPDILVDDRLVLELKVDPKETEKDRLIGQCCKYSQEWVTWAIVIDMPDERVDKLVALLDARSLNYIEVIPFNLDAEEDEDQNEDDED
ncbi:MAG: hypothetical protein WCF22_21945 [Candidatus Sulfotelmatobacter sp.]